MLYIVSEYASQGEIFGKKIYDLFVAIICALKIIEGMIQMRKK